MATHKGKKEIVKPPQDEERASSDNIWKTMMWFKRNAHNPRLIGKIAAVNAGRRIAVASDYEELDRQVAALGVNPNLVTYIVGFTPKEQTSRLLYYSCSVVDQAQT